MAAYSLNPPSSPSDLSAVLGKAGSQALAQIVRIVKHPVLFSHVAGIAKSIIGEARTGGSILADPSQIGDGCKGALEVAIAALHSLPDDAPVLLEAFAGFMQDLADLPDDVLLNRVLPPAGDWLTRPTHFLDAWLRSRRNIYEQPIFSLDRKLSIDRTALANLLERIEDDDEARTLIHGGHLGSALRLGRPFGDLDDEESVALVRGFARGLAVVIAHLRTALLRRWARTPMIELVSHSHERQTLARCLLSNVVAPAKAMRPLFAMSDGPTSMADLPDFLADTPLADPSFIALIETVAGSCPRPGNASHGFDQSIKRLQAEMTRKTEAASRINKRKLAEDDQILGTMTFVFDRLGVTPSHGTVLIAQSLLGAPAVIDDCVSAIMAGTDLPALPVQTFAAPDKYEGVRALMLPVDHLRRHVMPDRESEKMGIWKHNNKAGCDMIAKALRTFEAEHPERAIAALWIDPRIWFG